MEETIYKKVGKIVFGLLSPKTMKKRATVKIVTAELYDKEGYPVDGGLMDVRLGVIDPGLRCKSCGGKLKECNGHFGYIELARPVVHVKYVRVVLDVLRSVCRECNRILMTDEEMKTNDKKSKDLLTYLKNIKKCPRCNSKQYSFKIEKPTTFVENDKKVNPIEVRARLEKISDDDLRILGLNPEYARPEWMILVLMPIPPVTVRPSITLESGERSEDDLTHKLGDIVRINQRLFENINAGAPEVIIEDLWDLLQYHVTTYIDNTLTQIPPARHRSGQVLKTLTERIKSKEGRFRHNLAGKRVNYAARTVISPDPKIKFNEVGVPIIVAKELTIPEKVTEWNTAYLKKFIENGHDKYPGANYVITLDGKKKKVTDDTKEQILEELQIGCIVERHLLDGDISIFNRQPSLHRMSIMCHKIRVLPGQSFRLNPGVCVAPDTKVHLKSGIQRKIDELKNCWKESELATFDWKNKALISTELKKFWGLKPQEYSIKCYKLITKETGREITATEDHPFYTDYGIKRLGNININDRVIVRPLDTPIYEDIDQEILNEKDIVKNAPRETYIKHSLKILKELKLIPFNLRDQRAMILARLLGHLYGDGTFILKNDVSRLIFRGSKEDLEDLQKDILNLGFKPEKIYIKTSNGVIETIKGKKLIVRGTGASFEVRNKPIGILFNALEAPNGDKVLNSFNVPLWIMNAPLYIKREFLASYFGCELSKPSIRNSSEKNFRGLIFKMSKIEDKVTAGIKFIKDIEKLLNEFDIRIESVNKDLGNIRKDGKKTTVLIASFASSNKNQISFFGKIGYLYSRNKDNMARLAYQYLVLKQKAINERKSSYNMFYDLRNRGYKYKEISKMLNIKLSVLEEWSYGKYKAGLQSDFLNFEKWKNKYHINNGLVWETVKEIREEYVPFVYDVTTISSTHNFFANGFLTKNCTPYNADFDGDEMNLHIPQTEEARAEAEILMQVQTQIITPKNGLNVIGCIHDAITGNYLLTKYFKFSREEAIDMLYSIGINNFEKLNKKEVDGKDVFSVLLPDDFNFVGNSKDKQKVLIRKGKLVEGFIDKSTIGEDNGTLIRRLYNKYGEDAGIELVNKIFRLGIEVLFRKGFTTSISDTDLPQDVVNKNKEKIIYTEKRISELIELYKKDKLEQLPGLTLEQTLESMILKLLNQLRDKIGENVFENVSEKNPTILMAKSGAQGNFLNLAQMAAMVGQQAVGGGRISNGYRERTLPIFKKGSLEADSRGFIVNGYKQGLKPYEYFFHAITGRDSLMDTALRTPKSGYLYRRLANALQDIRVEYDHTVRDANGKIIQFKYGDDGIDISKSEGGIINIKRIVKEVKENV
ncbi:MAG: hypothetical protein V1663_04870 [archaeon]